MGVSDIVRALLVLVDNIDVVSLVVAADPVGVIEG